MENLPSFEEFLNESTKNSSMSYPLKTELDALNIMSGKTAGSWKSRKMISDLVDVFGNDVSILSGDVVDKYLQTWSEDDSFIYRVTRKNLQNARYFYIPSKYRANDQYDEIEKTR